MKYLIIDASLGGTGIRDYYNGGYIPPEDLCLNHTLIARLKKWLGEYENEHYDGYINESIIEELDKEGKEIARVIKQELSNTKMEYFSDAKLTREAL